METNMESVKYIGRLIYHILRSFQSARIGSVGDKKRAADHDPNEITVHGVRQLKNGLKYLTNLFNIGKSD